MLSENVCLLGVKLESYNVVMQRRRILGAQIQYSDMADFSDYTTVILLKRLIFRTTSIWVSLNRTDIGVICLQMEHMAV